MKKISFGNIKNFYFIGGGQVLLDAVEFIKNKADKIFVFTSERHYSSNVNFNGDVIKFNEALRLIGINCVLLSEFNPNSSYFNEFDSESIMITPSSEWIFKQDAIDRFFGKVVNIHGSYLPEMKGGGGVSWNALMGTENGGVTIHMVDSGIDTGDILIQWKYDFPSSLTSLEEYANLVEIENAKAIKIFLDRVINGFSFERIPQNIDGGSYWPRLKTEIHGYINWSWSAEEIHRFIVAFGRPYSGAKTFISSNEFNIGKSSFCVDEKSYHPFQYGIVYRVVSNDIYVAAKNGSLIIHNICRSDGEKVNPKKLIGHRFITPLEKLTRAMCERVFFKTN